MESMPALERDLMESGCGCSSPCLSTLVCRTGFMNGRSKICLASTVIGNSVCQYRTDATVHIHFTQAHI